MFYHDGKTHIESSDITTTVRMESVRTSLVSGEVIATFTHEVIGPVFIADIWFITLNTTNDVWNTEFNIYAYPKVLVARSVMIMIKIGLYDLFYPMMTSNLRGRRPW